MKILQLLIYTFSKKKFSYYEFASKYFCMNISWRTIFSPALIAGFFTPMDKTCDFVVNEEGGGVGVGEKE